MLSALLMSSVLLTGSLAQAKRRLPPDVDISKTPSAPPAPMSRGELTHQGVTRSFALFSPPKTQNSSPQGMIVMLHGCLQTAESFALSTKMNEVAIRENLFVLYPEQSAQANSTRCWNWFDPANQTQARPPTPGDAAAAKSTSATMSIPTSASTAAPTNASAATASERAWLVALIDSVANSVHVDRSRIYIAGLSAGAAMAANMLSCHPEIFAGGAIVAGLPFAAATDVIQGTATMQKGSSVPAKTSAAKAFVCSQAQKGRAVPVLIIQGGEDTVVHPNNAEQVLKHFEAFNDLRDDGRPNSSFRYERVKTKPRKARKNVYAMTMETYASAGKGEARLVRVKKLGHAWSGGSEGADFSDPKGPPANDLIWEFFAGLEPVTPPPSHALSGPMSDSPPAPHANTPGSATP